MNYLAIDLGLKRIGIAISMHKDLVTPLSAIIRKNRNQAASELKKILQEWHVEALVVGIPMGGSSEEEMRARVQHFVGLLEFEGELFYQDESFSSSEAQELAKGAMQSIRDGRIDSLAAMIILQRFLAR